MVARQLQFKVKAWYTMSIIAMLAIFVFVTVSIRQMLLPNHNMAGWTKLTETSWVSNNKWMGDQFEVITGVTGLGSRPPMCENRCGKCRPCEATQVPTTTQKRLDYANYEPEGWKCKCGSSFFNP